MENVHTKTEFRKRDIPSHLLKYFKFKRENRWILRNICIWHKPNCMPSSVKDRFTVDYEPIFFLTKSKKYWFESQYESLSPSTDIAYRKALRREKQYNTKVPYLQNTPYAKAIKKERGVRGSYIPPTGKDHNLMNNPLGRNKRCVWKIPTHPYPEAHFATFPPALVETPIKAGCPEFICTKCGRAREKIFDTEYEWQTKGKTKGVKQQSGHMATIPGHAVKRVSEMGMTDCGCNAPFETGTVLDPFMGSGTTGLMAKLLGRNYIGIELNKNYIKLAKERLAQENLF